MKFSPDRWSRNLKHLHVLREMTAETEETAEMTETTEEAAAVLQTQTDLLKLLLLLKEVMTDHVNA